MEKNQKSTSLKHLFGFLSFLLLVPFVGGVVAIYPIAIVPLLNKNNYIKDTYKVEDIWEFQNTTTSSTEYNLKGYLVKSKKKVIWYFEPNNYSTIQSAMEVDNTIEVWHLPGTNNIIYTNKKDIDFQKYEQRLFFCLLAIICFLGAVGAFLYFRKKEMQEVL